MWARRDAPLKAGSLHIRPIDPCKPVDPSHELELLAGRIASNTRSMNLWNSFLSEGAITFTHKVTLMLQMKILWVFTSSWTAGGTLLELLCHMVSTFQISSGASVSKAKGRSHPFFIFVVAFQDFSI
jgi:hypothetical protein